MLYKPGIYYISATCAICQAQGVQHPVFHGVLLCPATAIVCIRSQRRAAGLPPVSKEWFETRKTQLVEASRAAASDERRVWVCPLSGKKFASEKTYNAWTNSKKYREFVKKSGGQKPAPEVRELPRESRVPVGQQGAKFEAAAAKFAAVPAKKVTVRIQILVEIRFAPEKGRYYVAPPRRDGATLRRVARPGNRYTGIFGSPFLDCNM